MRWARIVIVLLVAGWLFGDTVRHYWPAGRDPNVIRFAHFGTYQDYNLWREIIAAFEAQHPAVHVRQEYVTGWYGHYDTKLRQQLLAGTCPDVVLVQPGPFASIAEQFADMADVADASWHPRDLAELDSTGVALFDFAGAQRACQSRFCSISWVAGGGPHRSRASGNVLLSNGLPSAWRAAHFGGGRVTQGVSHADFDARIV